MVSDYDVNITSELMFNGGTDVEIGMQTIM